jgi:hypothetical protein
MVLHGCETWSLILREEHRLRVFENMVLRRIFGPKRDEVAGGWRFRSTEKSSYLILAYVINQSYLILAYVTNQE